MLSRFPWFPRVLIPALLLFVSAGMRAAEDRIVGPIDPSRPVLLPGHVYSQAQPRFDRGPVDPSMPLEGVTILLRPDPSLDGFLDQLHTPGSANYRKFLNPEQFGERFGASDNDLAKIRAWLESEGLKVTGTARGRHWITVSGTAQSAGRAFHTEFHHYLVNGKLHFANAIQPSTPAALGGIVAGIYGLTDFHPVPQLMHAAAAPEATVGGAHYLTPDDFATIFDLHTLYNNGFNGAGQNIAVAGQTAINVSDINNFRSQFKLPASALQLILEGQSPGNLGGDELAEADLDIEWAGAIAPGATIFFVYSGDAFTSAQYAIDANLAPVVTLSFGACEQDSSIALRFVAQQANAQGITVTAASGDDGTATCDAIYGISDTQSTLGPSAIFPGDMPEITAVGGTVLTENGGNYWASTNNANGGSALSYIPEDVWNDTVSRDSFAASGGAMSLIFAQPSWQTGPGVPAASGRTVPDVSFPASPDHDGYEVVTGGSLSIFGGTSVSTPAFAGVVALLNQYLISKGALAQPGLGNINPDLYRLGQSNPGIFHDVTVGNNKVACAQASPGCASGLVGYAAGAGYDLATGWGSVDVNSLVTQWTTAAATSTTLTASPTSVALTDPVQLTATVTGSGATPTGTVTFLVADNSIGSGALANGAATFSTTGLALGPSSGKVTAVYGGDALNDASGATITVTINPAAHGSMVVPAVTPNPVNAIDTSAGQSWPFAVTLTNLNGVATTVTGFTIGSQNESSQISKFFGSSKLSGNSSLTANLALAGGAAPQNVVFTFSGADADGTAWSQSLTVTLMVSAGPGLFPQLTLMTNPGTAVQNPQANPACQWSQLLAVQNPSGFPVVLTNFSAGSTVLDNSISQIFGTNRIAPYGDLEGTYCVAGPNPPATVNYTLMGTSNDGNVTATVTGAFAGAAASPAALAVTPASITIPVAASASGGSANLGINFTGGSPTWTLAVLPVNGSTAWLTASPLLGTGSVQVSLTVSNAGLSNGVYQAMLVVQAPGAIPPYVTEPVAMVVGASTTTVITGAANNGSNVPTFAPGEQIAVYGTQLAPTATSQKADQIPLPLSFNGVSAAVNGVAAPFYYASPGQLDVQIPYETTAGPAILSVNNNGQVSAFPITVVSTAPGMYGLWLVSGLEATSAAQGSALITYTTGEGDVTPSLATGATPASSTAVSALPHPRQAVSVTVGGIAATVLFVGIPSGIVGLNQINFIVPSNAPLGTQPVVVTVGGVASPPVNIDITAAQ